MPWAASITFGASDDSKTTVSNSPEKRVRMLWNLWACAGSDSGKLEKMKFDDEAQ
jgi:hypothetical protein